MNALIGIGNSDNKLSQQRWATFMLDVKILLREEFDATIHGDWHSYPDSIYQNAAWCIEIDDNDVDELKRKLEGLAEYYNQDSIAWNELTLTEFLGRPQLKVTNSNNIQVGNGNTQNNWIGGK